MIRWLGMSLRDHLLSWQSHRLRRFTRIVLSLFICVFYLCSSVFSDFEDTGVGARPLGMGNAFVSLADDVRALYYNPAGLGTLKRAEVSAEYGRLYWGLDDGSNLSNGFIGFAHPLRFKVRREILIQSTTQPLNLLPAPTTTILTPRTTVQLLPETTTNILTPETTEQIKTDVQPSTPFVLIPEIKKREIVKTRDFGTFGFGWINLNLVRYYQENTFILSYGKKLHKNFSAGVNGKLLYQSYASDPYTAIDPVFDYGKKNSKKVFSIDLGVLWNLFPRIFYGITITDINRPDTGFKSKNLIPVGIKTGLNYREKTLNFLLEGGYRDGLFKLNTGGEKWFLKKKIAGRVGLIIGSRTVRTLSLGMSFRQAGLQIDYAFFFPLTGISDNYGSHRVSFVYRFGKIPKDELEEGSLEFAYEELKTKTEKLTRNLKETEDMREKLEKLLIDEAMRGVKEKITIIKEIIKEKEPVAVKKVEKKERGEKAVIHKVIAGETLQSIAEKYYGDARFWQRIYELNKNKIIKGIVIPGQILIIPPKSEELGPVLPMPSLPTEDITPKLPIFSVRANTAQIRSGAGSNFDIIGEIKKGEVVKKLDEKDGWLNIEYGDGKKGWVLKILLEEKR